MPDIFAASLDAPSISTCTMSDVVAFVVRTTPVTFRDRLEDASTAHSQAATSFGAHCRAREIATQMVMDCEAMISALRETGRLPAPLSASAQAIAFGCAAKVLHMPRNVRREIAERGFAI